MGDELIARFLKGGRTDYRNSAACYGIVVRLAKRAGCGVAGMRDSGAAVSGFGERRRCRSRALLLRRP